MSYVITGSPGTGKHTVADSISDIIKFDIIDINRIARESGLIIDGEVDTEILAGMMDVQKPSIIVGHLAPYVISNRCMVKKAVVLRRSPYELYDIYKSRRYSRQKILDNVGAEILDIIYSDASNTFDVVIQIDTTGNTPAHNTQRVLQAMTHDTSSDEVRWLHQISENGDMQRFFEFNR
ncbi:MAG: shikimate kinase [Cenarchaeum sp. SB0665_bin_23]|nr:shikimate kinase [Cenarchaeum sp. SB0667_bin_13]MXY60783.1 shikimate kinase [Cenarchaeum sp. SB0665_bin_23]MXZ94187.1 shikimate kinase [Cenarchaeum sp. SB0666_bin_15]MYB46553.1 shikimate kinase [Cenarchaeum sp. SB0662_bin_33]MYC79084.1 shikimate kinase [Cenarchaeum sp. SB0661_bin_35]MYD58681.1 shikimate kinase [Cenarchaeum sp. SB0678_bin_8]MYG32545.1 shikimate kinase [Cenarchaeum sp. SB0677_bin_16]MYI51943.1 shikimate kinase [Cenarchaeum sp. SB0673_bin_9]MYJ27760.1 shikimate kinase [Cena